MAFWSTIKHFQPYEFDSPDLPGSGHQMDHDFIKLLDEIRELVGQPLYINSGFRTLTHNFMIDGKKDSAHLHGYAADIRCTNSTLRYKLQKAANQVGIRRIGIAKTFIHLDNSPDLDQDVSWLY